MFAYLASGLRDVWAIDFTKAGTNFGAFYDASYNGIFLCDLLFAVVGYVFTFRLLDTHIVLPSRRFQAGSFASSATSPSGASSAQTTWTYEQDHFYWGGVTGGHPAIDFVWGCLILAASAIYAGFPRSAFGLRFSNLTHRGIITSGPYRWIKHPAYFFKCLSFWLISIPFLSNRGLEAALSQSALLILANAVYVARAYTEERHLSRDPVYREYQQFIRQARRGGASRQTRKAGTPVIRSRRAHRAPSREDDPAYRSQPMPRVSARCGAPFRGCFGQASSAAPPARTGRRPGYR